MLVNCVAYQDGHKVADIPVTRIREFINHPNGFVWVAVSDPEPSELEYLQGEFDLHPLAVEDAQNGHQRPKIEEYGGSLFVVLHMLEIDGPGTAGRRGGHLRRRSLRAVGPQRRQPRLQRRPGPLRARADLLRHGPAYVLYALMDAVVDRYFPVVDAIEDEIEAVEARIFAGQTTRANIESLYELKRKLMILKHAAGPLTEATGKLQAGRVPPVCAGLVDYFRDVYDHLKRLNQSIDNLRDTVTTATAVNLSLITLQESEVTKQLAAYAALAAVPTMMAGVYGMNFAQMPELQWVYGYPAVLAVMVAIDGYLFYRFRKAKWL